MESSMDVPQKIKNRTTIWPRNSTSGNISQRNENTVLKRYMHPHVHSIIMHNSQDMEITKCPKKLWDMEIIKCPKKLLVVCTHTHTHTHTHPHNIYNGILFSHKKERNSANWDNTEGL